MRKGGKEKRREREKWKTRAALSPSSFPIFQNMESEDDQWELCNDDGFVYKRKRRRLHPPPPPPEADQEAEKRRKERKRQTLLKLKAKYEKEILQWESLSNTLRSMQISAHQLQPPLQNQTPLSLPSSSSSSSTDSALLQDLLSQVTCIPIFRFRSVFAEYARNLKKLGEFWTGSCIFDLLSILSLVDLIYYIGNSVFLLHYFQNILH